MSARLTRVGFAIVALFAPLIACGPPEMSAARCASSILPGDLVITEVFADWKATPAEGGGDAGREWFEIYNATDQPLALAGLTLRHSRRDGTRMAAHVVRAGALAPRAYLVLGNATEPELPPHVGYGYGDDLGDLNNTDGGVLALACGGAEIDAASYGEVREGHARALSAALPPDYTQNDLPTSWCQASDAEFAAGNFGTPGEANDCRSIVSGQCRAEGAQRDAVTPAPGDLIITELMPSPAAASDATGEWFEAQVTRDVDLNGVGLDRLGDRAAAPEVIASADCVRVRAGTQIVFARSRDAAANGGLPAGSIAGTFRFALVAGTPAAPGDVAIVAGATVIDAVRWTRSTTGKALQLDRALIDPIANDTESNFCDASASYGPPSARPDLGSPGAPNAACPSRPPPGWCDDGGALRPIARPALGQLVISELLINPAPAPADTGATDAQREWFELTNTGATAFDLNELSVGRTAGPAAQITSARCLSVAPRGHAVLARSADPTTNGGLPAVAATFAFGLVDTGGDLRIASGATVLDTVTWPASWATSGVARQLDAAHLNPADNDRPERMCAATSTYGDLTNRGTPGAANAPCP